MSDTEATKNNEKERDFCLTVRHHPKRILFYIWDGQVPTFSRPARLLIGGFWLRVRQQFGALDMTPLVLPDSCLPTINLLRLAKKSKPATLSVTGQTIDRSIKINFPDEIFRVADQCPLPSDWPALTRWLRPRNTH